MKTIWALGLVSLHMLWAWPALSCTGFVADTGQEILIGNNEDYDINYTDTVVRVLPAQDNHYGCLQVGFGNQNFCMGGINDQGLFYDWFSVPPNENWQRYADRQNFPNFKPEDMLKICADIDEAITFFQSYNLEIFYQNHVFLVDESGRAAVVEWGEDDLEIIWKQNDFFVVTNFYLAHPEWGWYPCTRYDTAVEMLSESSSYSWELSRTILEAVHMEYPRVMTQYSNIYELRSGLLSFFNHSNFHEYIDFSLTQELAKGSQTYHIANGMSDITLQAPANRTVVAPEYVEFRWIGNSQSSYQLIYSRNADFSDPVIIQVENTQRHNLQRSQLSLVLLSMISLVILLKNRKKSMWLLVPLLMIVAVTCSDQSDDDPVEALTAIDHFAVTVENLRPATSYYWKLQAQVTPEMTSSSIVWSFTTSEAT
ncbi:hypothetical protein ACFL27_00895 [candidate division CSSED10-310 bacterium]|uniref:Fibronectin type-III domain-containing protein n=1 Tax=candidate division CSSED10-310 bacterium TaxID=2855610 RepID=A0ABV6YRA4_UNCC1